MYCTSQVCLELTRSAQELAKPLGFDPQREKSQWNIVYLECLALSIEHGDPDDCRSEPRRPAAAAGRAPRLAAPRARGTDG